ncbi:hypothetical protein VNO78_22772 [Psophocarpus tetragonolobus]|uniref:Uncharacterized protein n=1 Tax=Psophocarpus tetragonolobus TaxID=3891 RepID=A0AAN9XC66_PSOTE
MFPCLNLRFIVFVCGVRCKVKTSTTEKRFCRKFYGCGRYDGHVKYEDHKLKLEAALARWSRGWGHRFCVWAEFDSVNHTNKLVASKDALGAQVIVPMTPIQCVGCLRNRLFGGLLLQISRDNYLGFYCGPNPLALYMKFRLNLKGERINVLEKGSRDDYGKGLQYRES